MPRTVPGGIAALVGQKNVRAPIWLVKWELSGGTQYLSSGQAVNYGGNNYAANRVLSIPSFQAGLIDRKTRDFSKLEIELDNLASDGSSNFYFTALDAGQVFEDAKITIYAYSPDAADAVLMWWGFSGRPKFSGDKKTCTLSASFFWDSLDLDLPNKLSHQSGFQPTENAGRNNDSLEDEDTLIPIVFGVANPQFRPLIYDVRVDGALLHVNFVLSGCNGVAFSAGDLVAANVRLFGVTEAQSIEFLTGSSGQAAPANLSRFPDGAAHPNVAYAYAVFPITNEIKDRIDQINSDSIKVQMTSGRPLLDTTIPSENPVLIIKDLMRDPNFGLGLSNALFDGTAVTAAANYVGTRYQARYELRTKESATERIQRMLGDCHCYITFDNGLIQIRAKQTSEGSSATFATSDSGQAGKKIEGDYVDASEKDFSELINQLTIKYRRKTRKKRKVTLYDPTAQARAGGLAKKVVAEEFDQWDDGGVWDETQTKIIAAIVLREEQNGNLFIEFASPFWDALGVAPGDVITVYSPDIFGANNVYRVISQSIESEVIRFRCQVYKSAIYNDDFVSLGVDLLRGGTNTDAQGRPPDVVPVSLTVIDTVANDTEGKQDVLRGIWSYPTVDLAGEQANGIFREFPIAEVELWWRYTDEAINQARLGASVKHPTPQADFYVDHRKGKTVECFFVALGHNRARSPLGYIPDPTRVTSLTENLNANPDISVNVVSAANFAVNDYAQCEKEIVQILSKTSNSLTFVNAGGNRTTFFDSVAIAHPTGTEIAVAKLSYPSLTRVLGLRFTYPPVILRDVLQRGDGVRARWLDVDTENQEKYLVYFSTDADAVTNPAKLGVANPTWYLTNPLAPPTGVKLELTDALKLLILQEEIGGVGVTCYVRVAARNGKSNYSSQLSVSGNNSATGTGGSPPTDAPSAPSLALITANQPHPQGGSQALVRLKIFASGLDNSKTFAQVGTQEIVAVLQSQTTGKKRLQGFPIDDLTQTFLEVETTEFVKGEPVTWIRNNAWNGAGITQSAATNVNFNAGNVQVGASLITGLAITSVVPIDAFESYVNFAFTQPTPAVVLAKAVLLAQLAGEAQFSKEEGDKLDDEPAFQTPGAKTHKLKTKHPVASAHQYKIRLVCQDGTSIESAAFNATSQEEDNGPPNNGIAIVTNNDWRVRRKGLVGSFQTPTLQMRTHWKNTIIIHDNGAPRNYFDISTGTWGTTPVEREFGKGGFPGMAMSRDEVYSGGRTQFFVVVGVWNRFNGGVATYSADLGRAVTLGTSQSDPLGGDTAVPDPSALTPIWTQSGKHGHYTMPLPATNIVTFTKVELVIFATTSGGAIIGYLARNGAGAYISQGTQYLFDIGQSSVFDLNLKKADLATLFPNLIFLKAHYYVSNALGRSVNPSTTLQLNYSDLVDYLSARNAVNVIEVGESHVGTHNFVRNGDMTKNDPVNSGQARYWGRWQPSLGLLTTANVLGVRTNSAGVIFSKTEHAISIIDGSWFLVQKLGRVLLPGEHYVLQFNIKGSPSGLAPQMKAWLVKDNVAASIADLTAFELLDNDLTMPLSTLPGGGVSSTAYKNCGATERCQLNANLNDGSGVSAEIWLVIGIPTGLSSPNLLKLDRIKFARGRQPSTYEDNPLDIIGVEDTGSTGFLPGNVGDFSDTQYTPSGSQGGFYVGGGTGGGYA